MKRLSLDVKLFERSATVLLAVMRLVRKDPHLQMDETGFEEFELCHIRHGLMVAAAKLNNIYTLNL